MDVERQFRDRLEHTITWCAGRVDARNVRWCLRSSEFRPASVPLGESDPSLWNEQNIIEAVAQKRAVAVSRTPRVNVDQIGGRLLWCRYEHTNHNGLSEHDSQGFFDDNDNPPWDTWVDHAEDALISWVPSPFVGLAAEGISAECFDMLDWVVTRSAFVPTWLLRIAREMDGQALEGEAPLLDPL